jgi:Fic family protein
LEEAKRIIADEQAEIAGRERDVSEVRNYWNALLRVEDWARKKKPLTEDLIKRLHGLVENGPRAGPTPYRDGQNAIRDSISGRLIYLPPEAKDVPALIASLVKWANDAERLGLPVPHRWPGHYQFVTSILTTMATADARLLATFILHKGSHRLGGFFSGGIMPTTCRATPALTTIRTTTTTGEAKFARTDASHLQRSRGRQAWPEVRGQECLPNREELRHRAVVLGLFAKKETITSADVADELGLSERMARNLLKGWTKDGWLEVAEPSRRARAYSLSAIYRQYIGSLSAMNQGGEKDEQ